MRHVLFLAILALGSSAISLEARAACNVRGEFCGYPGWAANAFSHPRDRVPEAWLAPTERRTYRERRRGYDRDYYGDYGYGYDGYGSRIR